MSISLARRTATRTGLVAASVVAAVAGLGATAAVAAEPAQATVAHVAAQADAHNSLVGVWKVKGTADGKPVEPIFTFKADGTFTMVPEDHAYNGAGTWKEERDGSFTFHLEHNIYGPDGKALFQIRADQAGKVTGNSFTSSGISGRYDLNGNLIETFNVTISGTRAA
ncbi:hypothetical protein CTZ27_08605 [Streptomyces griseocarneus]|nr:hypothetical protein CTZ27_08605 [Streptomyces griseocarneus]